MRPDTTSGRPGHPSRLARFLWGQVLDRWDEAPEISPLRLRFVDPEVERAFLHRYFVDNVSYMRLAHVAGIAAWAVFGLMAVGLDLPGAQMDLAIRLGVAIPITALSLAFTYRPGYERVWRRAIAGLLILSGLIWVGLIGFLHTAASTSLGYAGLMIVIAFAFAAARQLWIPATVSMVVPVLAFEVVWIFVLRAEVGEVVYASFFLWVLTAIGVGVAWGLERADRLLYARELTAERERARADSLLLNTLPQGVIDRLKDRTDPTAGEYLADGLDEVTVVFIDLVGFTGRAATMSPQELVAMLDVLFSTFDEIADRDGLEKIKTVGDAYMVVAGAPAPRPDHAEAAARLALEIVSSVSSRQWPNGEPMQVRVGMASGPAVAGVIGKRKFSYDVWGDTVNLASRLESHGEPGKIMVSELTYERLRTTLDFSEPFDLDLKGKGVTRVRFLRGFARRRS